MKPTKIKLDNKGLNLDKEAITKLQETQIESIKGGSAEVVGSCTDVSCTASCNKGSCNTSLEEAQ